MAIDLVARARTDMKRISQGEFSTFVVFLNQSGTETATVKALATSHHLKYDPDTGLQVISKNVHVSVSEAALTAVGYTTRNASNIVDLVNHRVTWTDSTGVSKSYVVLEVMPDDSLGLIVLILGDYGS